MAFSVESLKTYPERVSETWEIRPSGYTREQVIGITKGILEAFESELDGYRFTDEMWYVLVSRLVSIRLIKERERVDMLQDQMGPVKTPMRLPHSNPCKMNMEKTMKKLRFGEVTNNVAPRLYCFLAGGNPEIRAIVVADGEKDLDYQKVAIVSYCDYEAVATGSNPVVALMRASVQAVKARPRQRAISSEEAVPAGVEEACGYEQDIDIRGTKVTMNATRLAEVPKWVLRYGPGEYDGFVLYSDTPQVFKSLEEENDC